MKLETKLRRIADNLTKNLFVNGAGERASRLALMSLSNRDLGAWSSSAVFDLILAAVREAGGATKKIRKIR